MKTSSFIFILALQIAQYKQSFSFAFVVGHSSITTGSIPYLVIKSKGSLKKYLTKHGNPIIIPKIYKMFLKISISPKVIRANKTIDDTGFVF